MHSQALQLALIIFFYQITSSVANKTDSIKFILSHKKQHMLVYVQNLWMYRTGVKKVKVNVLKCVNFLSFGSLKNSPDT